MAGALRSSSGMLVAVTAVLLAPSPAPACSVPVFRYALERWAPEPYECLLFHRGPLAPADRAAADALELGAGPSAPAPNVALDRIDLAQPVPERWSALWAAQANATLPWLVVRHPASGGDGPVLWAGTLTAGIAGILVDSPARRELARRILGGDSVVWVLLACGTPAKDDAAAAMLASQLRALEKDLTPSDPDATDPDDPDPVELRSAAPVKLVFSSLRVSRSDAAESLFVDMLLRSAGGPPPPADLPAVFPVFGRGRVLGALAGKNLGADAIRDAAAFLAGPCSCRVKEMNPGIDLLMTADWDSFVDGSASRTPSVPNLAAAAPALAGVAATPGPSAAAVATTTPASGGRAIPGLLAVALAIVVGVGVIAVVATTWVLRSRSK